MDSGYFLFSLDTELAWGHYDYDDLRAKLFSPDGSRERRKIERILAIFNEFEIVGTWAIVGHLWYERCVECEVCPVLEWRGRYASADQIIGTAHPLWYGPDVVERIAASPTPQEIAFHGYTHTPFSEATMSAAQAQLEISEGVRLAAARGVQLRAMVFPRNRIGHLGLFKQAGFITFRGAEVWPRPYRAPLLGKFLRRYNYYVSILTTPQVFEPSIDASGLVDLPASRWLFGLDARTDRRAGQPRLGSHPHQQYDPRHSAGGGRKEGHPPLGAPLRVRHRARLRQAAPAGRGRGRGARRRPDALCRHD